MKISYSWLKEHVPLQVSAQELSRHLLELGFEVVDIEKKGPAFKGVVTARILEIGKHPNADRLSLCVVDDGSQRLSVVCGAKNIEVGQAVPLARIGAELPGGRKLTPARIRGVESQGMLCSGAELGLSGDQAGIMVLDPQTAPGKDFAHLLGPGDEILDVEVTPNRPDCLSHRGLAREIAACFDVPLRPLSPMPLPSPVGYCPPISIDAPLACPIYVGRALTGVKIGPSPGWLAARLEAIGLRPINNVVDVTNYVLHDMGQPLHAFDMSRLAGPEIHVRFARPGESLKALDGKTYPVSEDVLVIADAKRPVAVAGVMGGEESAVNDKTTSVLLESAYFAPEVVRKGSRSLRLRSDSSYRFERGTDPSAVIQASERAAALLLRYAAVNGHVSETRQAGAVPAPPPPIIVSARRVNEILGSDFAENAIQAALGAIAAKLDAFGDTMTFSPPPHRVDLATPWDLAEETARLLGYERIGSEAAPVPPRPSRATAYETLASRCRRRLAGLGLDEAYSYDFVSEKLLERAGLDAAKLPRLANPVSDDWTVLRPSMLIGLLESAATNLNRSAESVRLFELGTVFAKAGDEVVERRHAAGLLLGPVTERFWQPARTPDAGFYDAKGVVADLLSGFDGARWTPLRSAGSEMPSDPFFHPGAALRLETAQGPLGAVGLMHPTLARAWGLERQAIALFDLDLDLLAGLPTLKRVASPVSPYPISRRDLSLLLDAATPYAELEAAARSGAGSWLQSLELVDVFTGKNVPAGKRSLTLRLTFGSLERTLTDAEVNASVDGALGKLKALGAELRS